MLLSFTHPCTLLIIVCAFQPVLSAPGNSQSKRSPPKALRQSIQKSPRIFSSSPPVLFSSVKHGKTKMKPWSQLQMEVMQLFASPNPDDLQKGYHTIHDKFNDLDPLISPNPHPFIKSLNILKHHSLTKSPSQSIRLNGIYSPTLTELDKYSPLRNVKNTLPYGPYTLDIFPLARYVILNIALQEKRIVNDTPSWARQVNYAISSLRHLHSDPYPIYGMIPEIVQQHRELANGRAESLRKALSAKGISIMTIRQLTGELGDNNVLIKGLEPYHLANQTMTKYLDIEQGQSKDITDETDEKPSLFAFGIIWSGSILPENIQLTEGVIELGEKRTVHRLSPELYVSLPSKDYQPSLVVNSFQWFIHYLANPKTKHSILDQQVNPIQFAGHLYPLDQLLQVIREENIKWWKRVREQGFVQIDELYRQAYYLQEMRRLLLDTLTLSMSHLTFVSPKVAAKNGSTTAAGRSQTLPAKFHSWIKHSCRKAMTSTGFPSARLKYCNSLATDLAQVSMHLSHGYHLLQPLAMYWRLRPAMSHLKNEGSSNELLSRLQDLGQLDVMCTPEKTSLIELIESLNTVYARLSQKTAHATKPSSSSPDHMPVKAWDQVHSLAARTARKNGLDVVEWFKVQFPKSTWPALLLNPSVVNSAEDQLVANEALRAIKDILALGLSNHLAK